MTKCVSQSNAEIIPSELLDMTRQINSSTTINANIRLSILGIQVNLGHFGPALSVQVSTGLHTL